jgi:hypothetical protein
MWQDVQFPKDLLAWIEGHPGLATWLGSIAIVATILATLRIAGADRRERQLERVLKAKALALLLQTQLVAFRGKLERAVEDPRNGGPVVAPPPILIERSDQLYLLGPAGGSLLQMISALNANADQVRASLEFGVGDAEGLLEGFRRSLALALECCDEALAGIDRIVRVDTK